MGYTYIFTGDKRYGIYDKKKYLLIFILWIGVGNCPGRERISRGIVKQALAS
ncbi:MAG: hypothetical protein V8S95_14020 [Odoribacter sp.]